MLGVVMDSVKLCGGASGQIAERLSLEEVTLQRRSITDFFKSPTKDITHKNSDVCQTTAPTAKNSTYSVKIKSKKRKRTSDVVDLNDSFNDFDNNKQKGSKKKAKSTDNVRKQKLSVTLACSPKGSQSGKENEEVPSVENTAPETVKRANKCDGGKQSTKKQKSRKCPQSSAKTKSNTCEEEAFRYTNGMKHISEKEQSKIGKGSDGQMIVEVSYEEFLKSEGVALLTCEHSSPNEEEETPQLTVPKCHKLFDYFKKKSIEPPVDLNSSTDSDIHVTQADVHFEPSPPHNHTADLNQKFDREERCTSNILISDEECGLNILEISSEVIEITPDKRQFSKESSSLKYVAVNTNQKTTQATLCFTKAGLKASKTNKTENNDQTNIHSLDTKSPAKPCKTKTRRRKSRCLQKVGNKYENAVEGNVSAKAACEELSDISLPSRRSSPRVKAKNSLEVPSPEGPESEIKKFSKRQTFRKRYKVAKLEAGGDNRSPIRIRLKRCSNSSGDEGNGFSPLCESKRKANKSVIKAQELVEKAKKLKSVRKVNDRHCGKKTDSTVIAVERTRRKAVIKPTKAKDARKLAPIFCKEKVNKTLTKSKPGLPLDILCQKVTRHSPVKLKPSEVLKQKSPVKRPFTITAKVQATNYPPFSANTHVQQSETTEGSVNVWNLQHVTLKLKEENLSCLPLHCGWTDYKQRRPVSEVQKCQILRRPDELGEDVIELLLTELQTTNPNYPIQRLYKLLKGKKDGVCKGASEESSNTVPFEVKGVSEEIVVLDSPSLNTTIDKPVLREKAVKSGKFCRSSKKFVSKTATIPGDAYKTDKAEVSKPSDELLTATDIRKPVTVSDQLWSDKYQPSESVEIIGNTGCVRKLKLWLQKWKERRDKEAKLLKKLLRKQHNELKKEMNPENSSDWWTDDESDFEGSRDTDTIETEDSLINTMLITGPHGVGKSSTVYALAHELGYQVLEVNASSCRSGKKILNKLQEATQSHRVSKQNLEKTTTGVTTPNKPLPTPADKTVISSPVPTKLPTAFTNLFRKAKESTEPVITVDEDRGKKSNKGAGTKRKRALSKDKDCHSPKKKVKPESVAEVPFVKTPAMVVEESNNSSTLPTKSLNLASNSLILFDEVDILFEEDKGFWSAIQCFMNTSKRPIILTTSDRRFCEKFEGRFDQLPFRTPPYVNVVTYLQIICLVENVRTDFLEIVNLVQMLKGDVRQCLQCLQWWVESGGGCKQVLTPVRSAFQSGDKNSLYFIEDTLSQSQDSNMGDTPFADRFCFEDNSDDFKRARSSRRRIICDESSRDSCRSPQNSKPISCLKSVSEVEMSDENAMFPCVSESTGSASALVHQMCVESISGATAYTSCHFKDLFLSPNFDTAIAVIDLLQSNNFNILKSNLELFLPLPICEVDQLKDNWPIKSTKEVGFNNNNQSRVSEVKTNSCGSESSDAEWFFDKKITETNIQEPDVFDTVKEEVTDTLPDEMKKCLHKSVKSLSDFYENSSYLDTLRSRTNFSSDRYQDVPSLNRCSVLPGSSDDLHTVALGFGIDLSRQISAEISVRSLRLCNQALKDIGHTARSNPVFIDNHLTLPVLKGSKQFKLSQDISIRQSMLVARKKVIDDVIRCLPLHTWSNTRSTSLDYTPTLRSICHAEQCRQIAKTKRRFLHYLDGISLPLRESTMTTLASSLR